MWKVICFLGIERDYLRKYFAKSQKNRAFCGENHVFIRSVLNELNIKNIEICIFKKKLLK